MSEASPMQGSIVLLDFLNLVKLPALRSGESIFQIMELEKM